MFRKYGTYENVVDVVKNNYKKVNSLHLKSTDSSKTFNSLLHHWSPAVKRFLEGAFLQDFLENFEQMSTCRVMYTRGLHFWVEHYCVVKWFNPVPFSFRYWFTLKNINPLFQNAMSSALCLKSRKIASGSRSAQQDGVKIGQMVSVEFWDMGMQI